MLFVQGELRLWASLWEYTGQTKRTSWPLYLGLVHEEGTVLVYSWIM